MRLKRAEYSQLVLRMASKEAMLSVEKCVAQLPGLRMYKTYSYKQILFSRSNNETMRTILAMNRKSARRRTLFLTFTTYTRNPASYPPTSPPPSRSYQQPNNPFLH